MFSYNFPTLTIAALLLFRVSAATPSSNLPSDKSSPVPLRILPLGASVTFGIGSPARTSYRLPLRNVLTAQSHPVNFVGRVHSGASFPDNECEATSGFVLSQIASAARSAAPMFLPNLILLEAGTNNCNSGSLIPDAGANMTSLVKDLFSLSPNVTVIVATLLVNPNAKQDACRVDVNQHYAGVVERLVGEGQRVVLADMRSKEGPTTGDLADGRHPNDRGYEKMAAVWNEGIQVALGKGFVELPAENGIPLDGGSGASSGTGSNGGRGSAVAAIVTSEGRRLRWGTVGVMDLGWAGLLAVLVSLFMSILA